MWWFHSRPRITGKSGPPPNLVGADCASQVALAGQLSIVTLCSAVEYPQLTALSRTSLSLSLMRWLRSSPVGEGGAPISLNSFHALCETTSIYLVSREGEGESSGFALPHKGRMLQ